MCDWGVALFTLRSVCALHAMCYGDRAVLNGVMCDWGVALFTLRSVCALHAMCYGDRAVLNVE